MAILHSVMIQLKSRVIKSLCLLVEFDTETISAISDNLKQPRGRIPDQNHDDAVGDTTCVTTFVFELRVRRELLLILI